jgi:phosphoribosylanthranilate isomerase
MIRVKICGITSAADAELAVALGASAIGLVFWPHSPRAVPEARAREIVAGLPPFVNAVGVFVNQSIAEVVDTARRVGLHAVQLHGDERPETYADVPLPVIKAIAVRDETARTAAAEVPERTTVLLDAHDPIRRGGTGRSIDWSVASAIARTRPVILSGGLHEGNVATAVRAVAPSAIDISSGVEAEPGRKDPAKLRALFAALREL